MSLNVFTAGDGPALLLLHGFTGTARNWSRQLEVWSSHHRVIAPDLLGHGASDAPLDPARYALDQQAGQLAELLDLLEAVPVTVVGYSMGARLALALTLAHPRHVGGLVLESPSAGIADPVARAERRAADDRLADDLERDGLEAFVDRWEALPLFAGQRSLPTASRARLRHERLSHQPGGLAACLRGAGQGVMAPLHDRLGEISVPTLVLAGSLDASGLERARIVAEGIPQARLEIVAGASHSPHLEAPHIYEQLVDDRLAATDPSHQGAT